MKEYFTTLLIMTAISVSFGYLVKGTRLEGSVRLGLSMLLFYTAITPLSGISFDGSLEPPSLGYDESVGEYVEVARGAFEEGIEMLVCREFSLDGGDVRVLCRGFDFSAMRAERICIYLSGSAIAADYKGIERLIESEGLGDAVCILE